MKNILIVDDDVEIRSHLTEILGGAGYETAEASSGSEAVAKATAETFDVILLDMVMPKGSGGEVLPELKKLSPRSKIIMITAFATVENAVDAMKRGACDYISKPFKIDELITKVRRVLEETRFEECADRKEMDELLSSLSNPIRTKIIRLIASRKSMRLMEIARELLIEDHTKVIFHLKNLKESGLLEQDKDKAWILTGDGERTISCLKIIDLHLGEQ